MLVNGRKKPSRKKTGQPSAGKSVLFQFNKKQKFHQQQKQFLRQKSEQMASIIFPLWFLVDAAKIRDAKLPLSTFVKNAKYICASQKIRTAFFTFILSKVLIFFSECCLRRYDFVLFLNLPIHTKKHKLFTFVVKKAHLCSTFENRRIDNYVSPKHRT